MPPGPCYVWKRRADSCAQRLRDDGYRREDKTIHLGAKTSLTGNNYEGENEPAKLTGTGD
jgi:hypothetical protein